MSISNITFTRFTRGEEKAIEKVYLEYKNLMYFIIASYVPNKFDVEDILSESFIKAVEHREEVKKPESLKSYLAEIAKNQALNFLKSQREVPSSDIIDEMYGEEDRSNTLLSTLEPLLTNKETIVTYLKVGFSYTWEEIAKETGISVSSARRIYEGAKEKLRKELL
ncbi:MAG: sigma-70 family RNA polymerase sigma factor [Bacilli bacterium]|nr:sigma-70 family RNA polymerase sigma factor [Bacilli bacterium]